MRSFLVLALLAAPTVAVADDSAKLQIALGDPSSDAAGAVLADRVDVEIPVETPACKPLSGAVARAKLQPCLRGLAANVPVQVVTGIGSKNPMLVLAHGIAFELTLANGKITGIHPVATNATDAKLVTTTNKMFVDFHPSPQLAVAADKLGGLVVAVHKVCGDETGKITSRRLVQKSSLAAFDMESTAWVASRTRQSVFKPWGRAVPVCDLVAVEYPDPGDGEIGGVIGGVMGGVAGGPPPPPPPPAPPQNIPPTLLEPLRTQGTARIPPDDATKVEIAKSGKSKVVASFKLCVSTTGAVTQVTLLKSSGFAAYDETLKTAMRGWAYQAYRVNDQPVAICTAVTFIYSQEPAKP